jgi:VanZ family protein
VRWWLAALAFAALTWWSSTRPITMPSDLPEHTDKVIHAITWGVLTALLALGGLARRWRRGLAIGAAIAVAVAYGIVIEWAQGFVPGRFPSLADVVADAIGAVAAGAATLYGSRRHGDRP